MEYFDTHAHYDDRAFDNDRDEVIKKAYSQGVTKVVDVGCDIETSKQAIELSKKYDFIYAICGIHPSEIENNKDKIDNQILQINEIVQDNKKIVAIGEIGLDYHYEGFEKELQKYAFIEQLKLANELKLPISIHTRDAIDDTIMIIKSHKINCGGILHCCPFNRELVRHGLENGLYIAFGGTSTFKNSKNACEIVNMVPDDKILIETDCPYLAPEPYRGSRNDSSNLKFVVQKLAEFRNCKEDNIAKITYNNAKRLLLNKLRKE